MTHRPIISMTERNSRVHHPSAIRATATFSSNRSATVNPFFRSFTSYIVPSSLADWSLTQPTRIRHISSTYALCHWSISRATRYYKIFPLFFSLPDDTRYSLRSNRECYELSRIGDTKKKKRRKILLASPIQVVEPRRIHSREIFRRNIISTDVYLSFTRDPSIVRIEVFDSGGGINYVIRKRSSKVTSVSVVRA